MNYQSLLLSFSVLLSGTSFAYSYSDAAHFLQALNISIPPTQQDIKNHQKELFRQADQTIKLPSFSEENSINYSSLPLFSALAGALVGATIAEDDAKLPASVLTSLSTLLVTLPVEHARINNARPGYERRLAQAQAIRYEQVKAYYQELLITRTNVFNPFNNDIERSLGILKSFTHEELTAFTTHYPDANTLVLSVSLPFSTLNFPLLTATEKIHHLIENLAKLHSTLVNIVQTHDSLPYQTKVHIQDNLLPVLKDILNTVQANALSIKQTSAFQIEELRKQEADLLRKKQEQFEAAQRLAQEQMYLAQQQKYAAQQQARKDREAYLIARQNQRAAHGQANVWADFADRVLTN